MATAGGSRGGRKGGLSFGEKLELALEWRGLTDAGLREYLGAARHRIGRWRGGQGKPSPEELFAICHYLKLPLEYFCDPEIMHPSQAGSWTGGRGSAEEITIAKLIQTLGVDRSLARLSGAGDHVDYHRHVPSRSPEAESQEQPTGDFRSVSKAGRRGPGRPRKSGPNPSRP